MHGPAILARRWMQLAVGTDQITAGCREVFTIKDYYNGRFDKGRER